MKDTLIGWGLWIAVGVLLAIAGMKHLQLTHSGLFILLVVLLSLMLLISFRLLGVGVKRKKEDLKKIDQE